MASKESLIIELDARTGTADANIKRLDKSIDTLDSSVKSVDKSLSNVNETNAKLSKTSAGVKKGIAGIGRSAGQAGIQVQQFVGQIQGGQSAMLALSQQSADLGFVLGAPLLGAVVGIGASIVGFLIPSLAKADDSFDKLVDSVKSLIETSKLTKEQSEFLVAQEQKNIDTNAKLIASEQKKIDKSKASIKSYKEEIALIDEWREKNIALGRTTSDLSSTIAVRTKKLENSKGSLEDLQAELLKSIVTQQNAKAEIDKSNKSIALYNSLIINETTPATKEQKDAVDSLVKSLETQSALYGKSAREVSLYILEQNNATQADKDRVNSIYDEIDAEKERQAIREEGNKFYSLGQTLSDEGVRTGASISIQDRLLSESEALTKRYERDKEILDLEIADIEERNATKLLLEQEYLENLEKIKSDSEKERETSAKKAARAEAKIETMKADFANRTAQTLLSTSMSTQQKLFSVVKDAAAGQIEAYGLTAGAKALAELGPIAGPPVSAQYIGWSQVAAGVVRALPLGGGSGGAGSPDSSVPSTQASESSFEQETSTLELTEQSEQGVTVQRLIISTDDGSDIFDGIAKGIEDRGRLS